MSEDKKPKATLLSALFQVQKECPIVKKSADNPFFKSKYADLPAVWDAVKGLMVAHNLLVTHQTETKEGHDYLKTTIHHVPTGESISSESRLHLQKPTSQEYGSCVTYMRRYAISALLGLVTENDDDDGNASSQKKPETKKPETKQPEIIPFTGPEFLALQKSIKAATAETFVEEKAKAKAAWPRMSEAHRKEITKAVEKKTADLAKADDIPTAWDKDGKPIHN